jgi:hypothetical protein
MERPRRVIANPTYANIFTPKKRLNTVKFVPKSITFTPKDEGVESSSAPFAARTRSNTLIYTA